MESTQQKTMVEPGKTGANHSTADALADNTHGTYTKHDVGVWLGLVDGSSPGVLVVASTLPAGQSKKTNLSLSGWGVQKYQWFWFHIVNGQRVSEYSELADAGKGYYFPELYSIWNPSRMGAAGVSDNVALQDEALVAAPALLRMGRISSIPAPSTSPNLILPGCK